MTQRNVYRTELTPVSSVRYTCRCVMAEPPSRLLKNAHLLR